MSESLLTVQYACEMAEDLPTEADFEHWVAATFERHDASSPAQEKMPEGWAQQKKDEAVFVERALTIRVVDADEIQSLNRDFRQKDKPTNVLSFPYEPFPHEERAYLGDIAICAPVVREEAVEQGKVLVAHWAHMTIHGLLHLLGYDHVKDAEAEVMEAMEAEVLKGLSLGS
jgi:probable rRNA maturation factor